jgi:uncharacterized protein
VAPSGGKRTPKFEIYIDRKGAHRWRLKASNGEIVATGEAYTTTADARRGVEAVRRAVAAANTAVLPAK